MIMPFDEKTLQRRVAGPHDLRLIGMGDMLLYAQGAAVLDLGCSRGMVGHEFARAGARLVHGCDIAEDAIYVARAVFMDMRSVESLHIVADLTKGPSALSPFKGQGYEITLCLATVHKLKRAMSPDALSELLRHLGKRTRGYFVWRATSEKFRENEDEMAMLDRELGATDMRRVHTSYLSKSLGVAAIWARGY